MSLTDEEMLLNLISNVQRAQVAAIRGEPVDALVGAASVWAELIAELKGANVV